MNTIDWSDVEEAAKACANNHRTFESFSWHDEPDDSHEWFIGYVSSRDSDLLTESNADFITKEMGGFGEDAVPERHSHWAVGWVDGFAIRVYRGSCITGAFRRWCELMNCLADYPCLDEEDVSRREYEATLENIGEVGKKFVIDEAPEDWRNLVFDYFWDNDQGEVEGRDGGGGYPSEKGMREALFDLDLLDEVAGGVMTVEADGHGLLKTLDEADAYRLAEHAYWKRLGKESVVIRVGEEVIHTEEH